MKYERIEKAVFLERKPVCCLCGVGRKKRKVHVKNTGRCEELLIPGQKYICRKVKMKSVPPCGI